LIDCAADRRAPTPTAAAEMVVPVRQELVARLARNAASLEAGAARAMAEARLRLENAARAMGDPRRLLEERSQRLDERGERMKRAVAAFLERHRRHTLELGARLPDPKTQLERARGQLLGIKTGLEAGGKALVLSAARSRERLGDALARGRASLDRDLAARKAQIAGLSKLLDSVSYQRVLERGFALVADDAGKPIVSAAGAKPGSAVTLAFADGKIGATLDGAAPKPPAKAAAKPAPKADQGSLL
jgi:exodeoxyribonuclease VII large subunit